MTGDDIAFGKALTAYAKGLNSLGLEEQKTYHDRLELNQLPGVLGVKGLGAMQSDGLLLFIDKETVSNKGARLDKVLKQAEALDLKLVNNDNELCRGVCLDES